jgi:CDP-glucose 4,6-dehydratase
LEGLAVSDHEALLARFAGRSVFLTGHTGFKGSWLTLWLNALGARVHGYSLPAPTEPSNFEASRVRECCASHHQADVRDPARLEQALRASEADFVFHLAAQPLVRDSYSTPADTFETNVMGTVRLLDAVRSIGRPCTVVVITSDKCYRNDEQVWGYRELDPMGGDDPYSASKGATELVVSSYRRSFFAPEKLSAHGIRLSSARAGNVIGGGDWARDRIICDMVRAFSTGQTVTVRNPSAVRPWQHVLEPLSGYLLLAQRMASSDDPLWSSGWNFGPQTGETLPVSELVDLFLRSWGDGSWRHEPSPRPLHEARILRLSIDKAISELGWKPTWDVAEAIARTATWYRRFYQGGVDMRAACLTDIRDYQTAMGRRSSAKESK